MNIINVWFNNIIVTSSLLIINDSLELAIYYSKVTGFRWYGGISIFKPWGISSSGVLN